MRQNYNVLLFLTLCTFAVFNSFSQVGINTTSPAAGSMLDVTSADKGVLLPRVNIADLTTIAPVTGGATAGLMVYNTNTTTGPGYFYWDGSEWVNLSNSDDWKTDGNAGTTPGTGANQHYVGTSDNQDLVFATNGTERFRITTTGTLTANGAGTVGTPSFNWSGDPDTGFYQSGNNNFGYVTGGIERLRIPNSYSLRAMGDGTGTAPFYSWASDNNTGIFRVGDDVLGISTGGSEKLRIPDANAVRAMFNGTAAAPFYSWNSDTDTGIIRQSANVMSFVTNGTERLRIPDAEAVRAMADGSNGTPFYSWNSDTDLGIWRSNVDRLNISAGGREMVEFNESGGSSEVVFNDGSTNTNFRVESDGNTNMLYVDGADNAVGFGTNTPGGILELNSSTNGFVLPRVSLNNTTSASPVVNPQGGNLIVGTTVYNTATSGTSPNNVAPGLYYWNGSRWVAYAGSPGSLDWTLTGNSGTALGTNFVGTTDNTALDFRTNSNSEAWISTDGSLVVNSDGYFGGYSYISTTELQAFSTGSDASIGGYGNNTNTAIFAQNVGGGTSGTFLNTAGDGFRSLTSLATGNGVQGTGGALTSYSYPGVSSGGVFAGTYGASGISTSATGTGVAGLGQGRTTIVVDPSGSGIAGSGDSLGIYGYAGNGLVDSGNRGNAAAEFTLDADNDVTTTTGNDGTRARAKLAGFDNVTPDGSMTNRDSYYGGYFAGGSESSGTPSYAYVGMRYRTNSNGDGVASGGQDYKIIGTGSVSTLIDGPDGNPRVMFAPEAPEILFQDFGVGQLVNGEARIVIDPILRKNIHVDAQNPLKVYVTLEGDCKGVFVTNKSAEGFTVKELQGGTSNAAFSWQIVASRADRVGNDGRMVSKHVGVRLPEGPGALKPKQLVSQEVEGTDEKLEEDITTVSTTNSPVNDVQNNRGNNTPRPNTNTQNQNNNRKKSASLRKD